MRVHCTRCAAYEDLQYRVRYLEGELGLRLDADQIDRLRRALRITPAVAQMMLVLYRAKGVLVVEAQLAEALPETDHAIERDDVRLLNVYVHRARKVLGPDTIETSFGIGYRMLPAGIAKVAESLREQAA